MQRFDPGKQDLVLADRNRDGRSFQPIQKLVEVHDMQSRAEFPPL
jgi:hypothetical protein